MELYENTKLNCTIVESSKITYNIYYLISSVETGQSYSPYCVSKKIMRGNISVKHWLHYNKSCVKLVRIKLTNILVSYKQKLNFQTILIIQSQLDPNIYIV